MGLMKRLFGGSNSTEEDDEKEEPSEEEQARKRGYRETTQTEWYIEKPKVVVVGDERYKFERIERHQNHIELYELEDLYVRHTINDRYHIRSEEKLAAVIPYEEIDGSLNISHHRPRVFKVDKTVKQKWLSNIETWNHCEDLDHTGIEEVPTNEAPDQKL